MEGDVDVKTPDENEPSKRVLAIGRSEGVLSDLDSQLGNIFAELFVAPSLELGLEMIRSLGLVDLVVVEHPLHGMSLKEFQHRVKACSHTPLRVAVLARIEDLERLEGSDDTDLIFLPYEESVEEVMGILAPLLTRAPRVYVRLMVRLEMGSGRDRKLKVAQTENISKSGMLLRTRQEFSENAFMGFEFHLPDDAHPISGTAMVIRKVPAVGDTPPGIAVHFQSLLSSDQQRLEEFLELMGDESADKH